MTSEDRLLAALALVVMVGIVAVFFRVASCAEAMGYQFDKRPCAEAVLP